MNVLSEQMKTAKEQGDFLSLVLRHRPEIVNLSLTRDGWADIDELIANAKARNVFLTRAAIIEIVATNDKTEVSYF